MAFNYGTPPSSVQRDRQIRESAMSGEEVRPLPSEPPTEAETDAIVSMPVVARKRSRKAKLDFTRGDVGFTLEFGIVDITYTDYSIALCIEPNMSFVPKDVMDFVLTVDGRVHTVTYAGGVFEFPNLNMRGLSFLLQKKEESSDQNGTS